MCQYLCFMEYYYVFILYCGILYVTMKKNRGILSISSQNIQGSIEKKIQFEDILSFVEKNDVVCFQETWLTEANVFNIPGYSIFKSNRLKSKRKKQGSGGVAIVYKSYLSKGIQKINSGNSDLLWVKFNKNFFGMTCDLYLCNCYIPPQNSKFHENLEMGYFDTLKDELALYSKLGEVMLCGDFNARVGSLQETFYDVENELDKKNCIDNSNLAFPYRFNDDKIVNSFGKKLIKFLNETNLIIVNGRKLGDSAGNKTCYKYNGSSTVDYFISTYSLYSKIINVTVNNQTWYSDHSPITCKLSISRNIDTGIPIGVKLEQVKRYKYASPFSENYKMLLNSDEIHAKFSDIEKSNVTCSDRALQCFKNIIYEVADKTLPVKIVTDKRQKLKKPIEVELGEDYKELKQAKNAFTTAKRNLDNEKSNTNRRMLFITARKNYRKIKYLVFNKNKEKALYKLANIESKDPKKFWKIVKKLINPHQNIGQSIHPNSWVAYFRKLLNVNCDRKTPFLDYINSSLPKIEKEAPCDGPLDFGISLKELKNALKSTKNNKAPGPDRIRNEMLKDGDTTFLNTLLYIFNVILKSGKYPNDWKLSYITPIYKSKDTEDPQNYRGIAISDCLSKVFCKIIDSRIVNYLKEKGIWKANQNGFQKELRTEDNIFILKTLFEKYVKKNNSKLYIAFIDFRKFFDTINRNALFYKMLKYGISGKLYDLITSAYSGCVYKVKTMDGLTNGFQSSSGVKQGCVLSPTLSNIFQNDLHDLFDQSCSPVSMGNILLNSLSFADDLLLISETPEGLQKCINRLSDYCDKWDLTINVEKTKCMVGSKGKPVVSDLGFYYKSNNIETVTSFKYLGLMINSNGKVNKMVEDRISKAKRAMFMLKRALCTNVNVSVELAVKLFDKSVSPILLYGCPIWGLPENKNVITMKFEKIPNNNIKSFVCENLKKISCNFVYDDIKVSRIMRESESVQIKFEDSVTMFCILESYLKNRDKVHFTMEQYLNTKRPIYEKVHANFCKFTLGVSKYASTTLSYGELGRFPIEINVISQCVLYWLRMEIGSKNLLLQEAYEECKNENHEWMLSLRHILIKNGLGHIMSNGKNLHKNYVKAKVNNRLKDQYIQVYNSYVLSNKRGNSKVIGICTENTEYKQRQYLTLIYNSYIRSTITKLRIDNNKSLECMKRNPRLPKIVEEKCTHCNVLDDVSHMLLHCSKNNFSAVRNEYYNYFEKYYNNFREKCDDIKLKLILIGHNNFAYKNDLLEYICTFIGKLYLKS